MNKQDFISLIDKFLSGEATPAEEEMMIRYYQSFQEESGWDHEVLGIPVALEKKMIQRLSASIRGHELGTETPVISVESRRRSFWWMAASIAGILFLCGYFLRDRLRDVFDPVKMVQVNTAKGVRRKLQLPDGSMLWLEGGSSFSYPEVFRGKERAVYLSGEAFFEVAGDATNPFIIRTPLVETKVLGTSFNIEAYGQKQVEVVVVSGKVSLNGVEDEERATPLILHPNEKALYDSSSGIFDVKKAPEAKDYELRKKGQFVYRGAAVADIIKDLERAYNTPIAIRKEILGCTFYGDFNAVNDVEKALHLIALTLNAKVEKLAGGRGYAIKGGGCQ